MRKKIVITSFFFFMTALFLSAQQNKQFVKSYTKALSKIYDDESSEWDVIQRSDLKNTFVFNYNKGNDIKVYFSNGEEEILTTVSKVERCDDSQCIGILSEKGDEGVLCLINGDVLLIYGKLAILYYN
ncbi:hypothetical protein [Riemerella columbipharyngis]|uniref:Uncharacterized protein n=1 Tax=Riemerella columbipharyngis TaxID=1071918 RepID=A0A1G6YHD5_9FLAO|nr:hypothetical protein [Riemerella columbipharyngis]SDD89770.1 hypothetical protein SAMN05421544_101165 [Riemerella columbipharyngis]